MKTIIFICPFFGRIPEKQMKVWLQTCKYNPTIDWLIITDDITEYDYPPNVKAVYMSFSECKQLFQSKMPVPISLNSPYKLCDYKPLYGYLFDDYCKEYDYWGHCDFTDTLFGNLRMFFSNDILENAEKILYLGHMTIYKNTTEVNKRFNIQTQSGITLTDIFSTDKNMAFDELKPYSINQIYRENGFQLYRIDNMYADVCDLYYNFILSKYDENYHNYLEKNYQRIFEWKEGHLYDCVIENGILEKHEIGYVHYQKRNMEYNDLGEKSHFFIIPNKIVSAIDELNLNYVKSVSKRKILYKRFFELKYEAFKYHINRWLRKK